MIIRIRRLSQGRFARPPHYEIEFYAGSETTPRWTKITRAAVTTIDPYLGVGDAWALRDAADAAWDGTVGQWVAEPPSMAGGP